MVASSLGSFLEYVSLLCLRGREGCFCLPLSRLVGSDVAFSVGCVCIPEVSGILMGGPVGADSVWSVPVVVLGFNMGPCRFGGAFQSCGVSGSASCSCLGFGSVICLTFLDNSWNCRSALSRSSIASRSFCSVLSFAFRIVVICVCNIVFSSDDCVKRLLRDSISLAWARIRSSDVRTTFFSWVSSCCSRSCSRFRDE